MRWSERSPKDQKGIDNKLVHRQGERLNTTWFHPEQPHVPNHATRGIVLLCLQI